jgi:pimeloyl-ACP methyl ester carboxylesterase
MTMSRPSLLLVHSPVVGPSTWVRLAQAARSRGATVAVPDLTGVVPETPDLLWPAFVETAVRSTGNLRGPIDVVGHSAAGALIPLIGLALGDRLGALVFVDAVIPPHEGTHRTPAGIKELLDQRTSDGVLAPWLDWWPAETLDSLLPDALDRSILRTDMPGLPRSYYDEEIPVPKGWSDWPCRYLRLSSAYDSELARSAELGWPTASIDGTHLSIFTDPDVVLEVILSLGATDQPT